MADNDKTNSTPVVDLGALKGVLDRLEAVEKANKEKDEQIEILRNSVSRYKLEEQEFKRDRAEGLPKAKLMFYNGKVVTSFEWVKKEYVYNPMNPNVPYGENLKIVLTYLDGTVSPEMDYINYVRNLDRVEVEKVGEAPAVDKKGRAYKAWIVRFLDNTISEKNVEIDPQFINP